MIGRDIGKVFRPKDRKIGKVALRVENLTNTMRKTQTSISEKEKL